MPRSPKFIRIFARAAVCSGALLAQLACESTHAAATHAQSSSRGTQLEREIFRLSARVNALEIQLNQERRSAAARRLESNTQRERLAAFEGQASAVPFGDAVPRGMNVNGSTQVQAELRRALPLLMRAIERLDISSEEKAALKSSLRPSRALDPDNPWSIAKY